MYVSHIYTHTLSLSVRNHVTDMSNTGIGAAFGTAKSGIGIAGVGTFRPELIMKVSAVQTPPRAQARPPSQRLT